ncbi:MAG: DNA polymerase III subunit [Planctomycetia bacterium]|nr:DNA polymerase III subunit [Planctomycetia bacterium]
MPWHSIRGVDRVVGELRRVLAQGRFPHALLFVGPEGVGKKTFARKLAQALLCERVPESALDPCEACPGCLQVKADTHPDLLQVARPEDKHELPIKVMRDLCIDLGLKPMHGVRRVAIVDDADDLNDEAANAFLKTLEEPPPGSVLILIGTSAEVQLDTIVSRCRVVRFDPLPLDELAALLTEQGVTADPAEADRLARLGKESVDQRGRARLLVGELARFFRGLLWQTAGLSPPATDPDDRRAVAGLAPRLDPDDVFLLADRCLDADYHIQRKVYMPLILDALTRDLGKLINPKG